LKRGGEKTQKPTPQSPCGSSIFTKIYERFASKMRVVKKRKGGGVRSRKKKSKLTRAAERNWIMTSREIESQELPLCGIRITLHKI